MPRGGHRGGIYPISGLPWGPGQRYLKRGLYRHQRTDVFVPRWGWRRERLSSSPLPDGSTKKWEPESSKAWPLLGLPHHQRMYTRNEARYLQPALRCTYTPAVEHILNLLEPAAAAAGWRYSGLGRPEVRPPAASPQQQQQQQQQQLPLHLVKAAREVEREAGPFVSLARLPFLERGRIDRLWRIVQEADTWRYPLTGASWGPRDRGAPEAPWVPVGSGAPQGAPGGPPEGAPGGPPIVDERAAVVQELPLAECLYTRSNHRLQSRRHPIWQHLRYKKDKAKIPYLHRSAAAAAAAATAAHVAPAAAAAAAPAVARAAAAATPDVAAVAAPVSAAETVSAAAEPLRGAAQSDALLSIDMCCWQQQQQRQQQCCCVCAGGA
ncbi:hypothetical protein, conserved [Eimeria tenella]|uniref:Uncharacterized protein n=1 Tax=Eimeria tenella TaxID=5802 RepID=U6KM80_EIMTE|nr:hypothetical protein, conserved [Eimeria tenella]CDJ37911.1 hypothetical protein, conserved [Eimeria tenella]|eukprot:XP_013228749.1 hypothetical protein, conserved [Eimeria tenella]